MRIYLKIYSNLGERMLAACDADILGKKFSEGDLQIDVKENFYRGELTDIENLKDELSKATIANLAGNNVVDFAIKNKFVDESNVLNISGIKHAQIAVI